MIGQNIGESNLKYLRINLLLMWAIIFFTANAFACTDFRVTAKDGTVIIARSMEYAPDMQSNLRSSTQWVVFKDLTHKILYYRTYGNLSLRAISLSKINFSENAPRLLMPIATPEYITDLTDPFLKSVQAAQ